MYFTHAADPAFSAAWKPMASRTATTVSTAHEFEYIPSAAPRFKGK
jgi:hypothetical protein